MKKLGNCGITTAYLYNNKGIKIGECLDTPNNVAYAFAVNKAVCSAKGIIGYYNKNDIMSRKKTAMTNCEYHAKYVKFY